MQLLRNNISLEKLFKDVQAIDNIKIYYAKIIIDLSFQKFRAFELGMQK